MFSYERGTPVHVAYEDRVLDGPASGEKGFTGGPYRYCNPRTRINYRKLKAAPWLPWLSHTRTPSSHCATAESSGAGQGGASGCSHLFERKLFQKGSLCTECRGFDNGDLKAQAAGREARQDRRFELPALKAGPTCFFKPLVRTGARRNYATCGTNHGD